MNIKISIIIPVYNAEKTITRSLDSLVHQDFSDIEIIVIDDCSKDNTLSVLNKYKEKEKRLKLIAHSKNQSQFLSRKRGLDIASGKYTMFLDADDTFAPGSLKDLYNLAEQNKVDMIEFGFTLLPSEKKRFPKKVKNRVVDHLSRKPLLINSVCNKIYSTDLLKKAFTYLPEKRMTMAEDLFQSIVISHFFENYMSINKPYYNYYSTTGTSNRNFSSWEELESSLSSFNTVAEETKIFLEKINSPYIEYYEEYLGHLFDDAIRYQILHNAREEDIERGLLYVFNTFNSHFVFKELKKHRLRYSYLVFKDEDYLWWLKIFKRKIISFLKSPKEK